MYRLLDNVLDEMRRVADRDDDGGLQGKEPNMDKSWTGDNNDVSLRHNDGQWKFLMKERRLRGLRKVKKRRTIPFLLLSQLGVIRHHTSKHRCFKVFVDASSGGHLKRAGEFRSSQRSGQATNVGIKEGSDLITQVKTYGRSSRHAKRPRVHAHEACVMLLPIRNIVLPLQSCEREHAWKSIALQRRIKAVIERYSGLGIVDNVHNLLGKIREDCKAVVPHGRRLASAHYDSNLQGYYELTADCSLSETIEVPAGQTLTIVGIGNPTIDRGESGRHFFVNGHLKMTGVTLTKGKVSVSHVTRVKDCVAE